MSSLSSEHLVFLFSTAGNDLQGQKTNSIFLSFGSKWLVSYPGIQILNNVRYKSYFFREAILMFNEEGFFWLSRKVKFFPEKKAITEIQVFGALLRKEYVSPRTETQLTTSVLDQKKSFFQSSTFRTEKRVKMHDILDF